MYDGLTPLFDNVTNSDLTQYFKSEKFGISTAGPGTTENVPRPGVTIVRDKYDVPHVTSNSHDDGVWAAGWIAAEDRGLLLSQARYNAYVAAIDAPGLDAVDLIASLQNFQPSDADQAGGRPAGERAAAGRPRGRGGPSRHRRLLPGDQRLLRRATAPRSRRSPATDIFALNALKDQFVGEGGGDEARRSEFLGGLEQRRGVKKGYSVFNDLRQNINKGSPTTVDGKFKYEHAPTKPGAPGSVVLDPNSFTPTPSTQARVSHKYSRERPQASNELMIDAQHSDTGTSAARRRAADRLLLPRLHLRDRHARAATSTGAAQRRRRSPATC